MTRYWNRGATLDQPRLRMFCFPFAGGGASAFSGWQSRLDADVTVVPVQLPGREGRMAEPRFTDLSSLVADLADHLGPELDQPHVFYGHSMGAVIAYALAQHRWRLGERLPTALFLAAHRAPHLPAPPAFRDSLPDEDLVKVLADLGGLPRVLLNHPEWLAALLPVVRDDLMLCKGVAALDRTPLPVPLHALAGADDRLVTVPEIRAWARYSSSLSNVSVLPGGHFFQREREQAFLTRISALLRPYEAELDLVDVAS